MIHNSTELTVRLTALYYSLLGKDILIKKLIPPHTLNITEKNKDQFLRFFQKHTHENFTHLLSQDLGTMEPSEIENLLIDPDLNHDLINYFFENSVNEKITEKFILYFKSSFEFGFQFLLLFNLKYQFDQEILPNLPDFKDLKNSSQPNIRNTIIGTFSNLLAQAASTVNQNYPIRYGELTLDTKIKTNDYWKLDITQISSNIIRITFFTRLNTINKKLKLIFEDHEKTYKIASLSDIEDNSIREFEIDTNVIPLCPWQINQKDYHQRIYIIEEGSI